MINKLRIQNFKSWQDTGEIKLANITGFFGANSSGKSSLLQFLLLMKQTVEETNREKVINIGDEKSYVKFDSYSDLLNKYFSESSLIFSISWDTTVKPEPNWHKLINCQFDCSIDILPGNGGSIPVLSEFTYQIEDLILGIHKLSRFDNEKKTYSEGYYLKDNFFSPLDNGNFSKPLRFYGFPREMYERGDIPNTFLQLPSLFEKMLEDVNYLGPLREELIHYYKINALKMRSVGKKGENAIPALISWRRVYYQAPLKEQDDDFTPEVKVALWLKTMGLIYDFVIKETHDQSELFEIEVRHTKDSPWVNILDVGFGVSQVLPVIVLCFIAPEGSTLLFEQPEIHLHPAAQYWLADLFIEVAKERKLQIIFESHSEHILNRLQRRIAENQISNAGVALYFTSIENGSSRLTSLQMDEYGNISNWPVDFFGDRMGEVSAQTLAALDREIKDRKEN